MNHDAIDRALRDEPQIKPSSDFTHRVMRSVRQEETHNRALRFPWQLLAGGLGVATALTFVGAVTGEAPAAAALPQSLPHLAPALAWLSIALAGSLGVAWWSVRFAGR